MPGLIDSMSDDEFRQLILKSTTYKECLQKLRYVARSGAAYRLLKRRIEKLEIDTRHFCQTHSIKRTKDNVFVKDSTCDQATLRKWFSREDIPYRCSVCGQEPFWNGQAMIMILDHINGINNDDRLENLRWVCPNCNSQLPTTNGKNAKNRIKKKVQPLVQLYQCPNCGKSVRADGELCKQCKIDKNRAINKPPVMEFAKMVKELGFSGVGAKYGVSGRTAQNWCKEYYHIPHTKEELIAWYNTKMNIQDPIKKKRKRGDGSGVVPPPKPVKQIDPNTNEVVNTFSSLKEAARAMNGKHTNISRVCNGERNTAYGYKWAFAS